MNAEWLPFAIAARALLIAARRAHERGDVAERDELLDESDAQLVQMIEAMPGERRPSA